MALTRPRIGQINTSVFADADPITVLNAGSTIANVDVGFLMNRANGLVSNVALYWNESGNTFVAAFTSNTGTTNSNIAVTGYANIVTGGITVNGPILPAANVTYDLGSPTQRFRTLYLSGSTIDLGGALISSVASGVTITHDSGATFTLAATGTQPTTSNASGAFGNIVVANSANVPSLYTTTVNSLNSLITFTSNVFYSSTLYGQGIYDTGNRVLTNLSSSGSGNLSLTISAPSSSTIALPTTGPGITTVGSSTAIPVITTDAYGRISALSSASITTTLSTSGTSGTGTVSLASQSLTFAGTYGVTASASNQTITISTPQDLQTTAKPTFANATISQSLILGGNIYAGGTTGLTGQVLSSTGTGLQWTSAGGFNGGTISGSMTMTNTTDSTSSSSGALVVTGGVGIQGNVFIGGTLTVANLQARGSTNIVVQDPMVYFQANVLYPWTYDTGLYSDSIGGLANVYAHHGMVRNVSNSTWGFFSNVKSEPGATVNWLDAGLIWDKVQTGDHIISNTTVSTSTTTGALQVAGGAGIVGAVYAGSVYDNGNRVLTNLSSSGSGNLTVSVSAPASTTISLPTSGPGATTIGSASAIPVITTDAYGRIASLTTASVSSTLNLTGTTGVGAVSLTSANLTFAGTNGVTATVSGNTVTIAEPQNLQTSATPTFAGGNFTGNVTRNSKPLITNFTGNTAPSSPQQGDEWYYAAGDTLYKYVYDGVNYEWLDLTSPLYNASTSATASTLALRDTNGNLTATNFIGTASSAKYADLAEIYVADNSYEVATVVVFGGEKEITVTDQCHDPRVAGVISTNPAYLMNSECKGLPVAFTGRVPCRVQGPITKGQLVVTSTIPGVGQAIDNTKFIPGCVIGKSLENITTNEIVTIEVAVGRF